MAGELLQVVLGLAAVVMAIFATGWLIRRTGAGGTGLGNDLRVLGGVAVGNKERVVLVECRGTTLLLGVAQGNVSRLHVLPDAADQTAGQAAGQAASPEHSFSRLLAGESAGQAAGPAAGQTRGAPA